MSLMCNRLVQSLGMAAAGFVLAARCSADLFLFNSGFESPASDGIATPTGWTAIGGASAYNPYAFISGAFYSSATTSTLSSAPAIPGTDGIMVGFVYLGGVGSGFSQALSGSDNVLEAGMSYTLTVAVGQRDGATFAAPTLGSEINLLAGSTVIASSTSVTTVPGRFVDQTAIVVNSDAFASLIGQPLSIEILTTLPVTMANQATDWDNVRIDATPVPEPGETAALSGAGLVLMYGLGKLAARRRNQL